MFARHPHPLARRRGMQIPQWPQRQTRAEPCIEKSLPQRTPGQPNSFSAYSLPSVAEHPSEIPQCLNTFLKKQSQKQHGERRTANTYLPTLPQSHPSGTQIRKTNPIVR